MIWDNNDDIEKIVVSTATPSVVQQVLNASRELRKPYVVIVEKTMVIPDTLKRILVPVTMLQEEVYKSEICAYLCRKTGAEVTLLQPKDYGHRAQENIDKIITFLNKFDIHYSVIQGKKDSMGINKEASRCVGDLHCDLLLLTASREYGLDDLLFGPVERYAILHSSVPVMLVNPRADLFSLCD